MDSEIENFKDLNLDSRLFNALNDLNYTTPTDVQSVLYEAIRDGKNLVVTARTGSGKTAAYMIPIIQALLTNDSMSNIQQTSIVILCPSKELCKQSVSVLNSLIKYTELTSLNVNEHDQKKLSPKLLMKPDFIIGTPTKIESLIEDKLMIDLLDNLTNFIVDEADLVAGFGHQKSVSNLLKKINKEQCKFCFMSATLGEDIKNLNKMIKVKWFKVQLDDSKSLPPSEQLTQYVKRCSEDEKYNILVTMFKLKLLRGKTIIFTNTIDKCYSLKFLLDSFYVSSVVLNNELPIMSRNHILEQFNNGKYDLLIASDENDNAEDDLGYIENEETQKIINELKNNLSKKITDTEYTVSRGIDYHLVSNILNFDCPKSWTSYVHRVGRCARNNEKGNSLLLVSLKENDYFEVIERQLKYENDGQSILKEFICSEETTGRFKYRVSDVRIKCTKGAIRAARFKEIKQEIRNSEHLKTYFDEKPEELQTLKHGQEFVVKKAPELKHTPEYIKSQKLNKKLNKGLAKKSSKKGGSRKTKSTIVDGKFVKLNKLQSKDPLFSFKMKNKKGGKRK